MAESVWFWQRIVSPHMAELAEALANTGKEVTYVAEERISANRATQGWSAPTLRAARLVLAPEVDAMMRLATEIPSDSIHICQGLRGNGLIGPAQKGLARRRLRQWVTFETIDEGAPLTAIVKRLEYARLIRFWRSRIEGILAIGHATPDWLVARGMPLERIVPFAYFLPEISNTPKSDRGESAPFRVLFVGQFIERKRLDLLIDALALLKGCSFELAVVGSGHLEAEWRQRARDKLGDHRVVWFGRRPIGAIPALMADSDCLVLPSRHDGWGAVISEALMVGTPAIASDRCGAAGVIEASGRGGVFPAGDLDRLTTLLKNAIQRGKQKPDERAALALWSRCLGVESGAKYLNEILCSDKGKYAPVVPWWNWV